MVDPTQDPATQDGTLHKQIRIDDIWVIVFYRSFAHHVNDSMAPCGSVNLVEVGTQILVCEPGRLLARLRAPTQKYEAVRVDL